MSPATYWCRRVAVVLVAVALVLVMARAGVALGGSTPAAPERHPAPSARATGVSTGASTVVRPGDSLWSVAQRLAPGEDPRPVVDSLAEARHGTVLTPGETITWNG